jgi:hypothetical protein
VAGTGRGWIAGLAFVTGILASPLPAAADPTDFVTIGVLLLNPADVAPDTLTRAKLEATRIYQGLRITLVWTESDEAAVDYQFTVKIVSEAIAGKVIDGRAMGVAVGTREKRGTLAYAFYGRIADVTRTIGADTGLILGHVIAHEIGHLLLPYDAHAKTGLMRGGFDQKQAQRAATGLLTFTSDEAALIRTRLQNVTETTERR